MGMGPSRLSECKTLEEVKHFVPRNPEREFINDKGMAIPMDEVLVHVFRGKFVASRYGDSLFFGELFTDEDSYNEYAKNREIETLKADLEAMRIKTKEKKKRLALLLKN